MPRKQKKNYETAKKLKIWTIICLVLALACALLLRSVVLYRLYPLDYKEEIEMYSKEYALDPYFVSALILAESHFNSEAVSPKGAIGLMQVMPDTGAWVAEKIEFDEFEHDMLFDPSTNIRIGCWYLHYLTSEFNGEAEKVIAAYNAGPARVREWLETDDTLEHIPFSETSKYLEKVMRNYEIYKGLYNVF